MFCASILNDGTVCLSSERDVFLAWMESNFINSLHYCFEAIGIIYCTLFFCMNSVVNNSIVSISLQL